MPTMPHSVLKTFLLLSFLILRVIQSSEIADDGFYVKFKIQISSGNVGEFVVKVDPSWAPKGAARFRELVDANFLKVISSFKNPKKYRSIHAKN